MLFSLINLDINHSKPNQFEARSLEAICNIRDFEGVNKVVEKEMLNVLVGFYTQKHSLLKELMKIELIHGTKEISLFN